MPHPFSSSSSPQPLHLARVLLPFGLLLLVSLLMLHGRPDGERRPPRTRSGIDPAALFLSLSPGANASIAADLRTLTAEPHLAGTAGAAGVATHVLARLRAAGLRTLTYEYASLLSYRAHTSLALLAADRFLPCSSSVRHGGDEHRKLKPVAPFFIEARPPWLGSSDPLQAAAL